MDQQNVSANAVNGSKNPHSEKPEKFKRVDFKRLQQKMLFYLTTLNLAYVVKEDAPQFDEDLMSKWAIKNMNVAIKMMEFVLMETTITTTITMQI